MKSKPAHIAVWQQIAQDARSMIAAAQQYLLSLEYRNYSSKTIINRRYYLGRFLAWCDERALKNPAEVNSSVVERYHAHLLRVVSKRSHGPLSDNSRYIYLKTGGLFFDWMLDNDLVLYNPFREIQYPRYQRKLPGYVLCASEVEGILNEIDISSILGIRDRAIIETLYSTGIRACELVALSVHHLDMERGTAIIIEGKGKKDRIVPVGERALKWLEKYLYQARPRMTTTQQNTLFVTRYGTPFADPQGLRPIIARYKKAAGIDKKGGAHLFRHSMATLMFENGADIRYIQEILGHESLNTTEIYTRVSIQHLKLVHSNMHPAERDHSQQSLEQEPQTRPRQLSSCPREPVPPAEPDTLRHLTPTAHGDLIDLAHQYFQWMNGRYALSTIDNRGRQLSICLQWCLERAVIMPIHLTKTVVQRYHSHLSHLKNKHNGQPLSAAYRSKLITALAKFCSWMVKRGHLLFNPASHIPRPRVPRRLPRNVLSAREVEIVLAQPDIKKILGVRDRAILETLYSTGIRRCECAKLKLHHLHFDRATLFIDQGKGRKDRYVPIGQRALTWIQTYLDKIRPLLTLGSNGTTLFFTKYGIPFTAKGISIMVRQYVNAANIGKKGASHLFRHSMATLMLENGTDVRHLQEILGHESLETTQIYTKVSIRKLKEIHNKTHPATSCPTKTEHIRSELEQNR